MLNQPIGLISADWPIPGWVSAVTTTRHGGFSTGPYASANLADHVGDQQQAVVANRRSLCQQLALTQAPCWLSQQHGRRVIAAGQVGLDNRGDACITAHPGVVCAVLTADCLPILLCDPAQRRIAAIHAGWRGLCAGVIENTVTAMTSAPTALIAWLGPTIRSAHYLVGADVRDAVLGYRSELHETLYPDGRNSWRFDLAEAARLILYATGVASIWDSRLCTFCDDRFFSYRRTAQTGRTATLIWMQH